jgi:Zn-dependent metalloprotease
MTSRIAGLACLVACVLLSRAHAAVQAGAPDGSILLPIELRTAEPPDAARQAALTAGPAWTDFLARNGDWSVVWNVPTGTPHRAFGPAVKLSQQPLRSAAEARAASLTFIRAYRGLLGTDADGLRFVRASHVRGKWYVSYVQTYGGRDVLLSEVELRLSDEGHLMAFGADVFRGIDAPNAPVLVPASAVRAALDGLPAAARADAEPGQDALFVLPVVDGDRTSFHLVYRVDVRQADPPANFVTLVDAATGTVLWRHNRVRYQVRGRVEGAVQTILPTDPFVTRTFSSLRVLLGATSVNTDSTGAFAGSPSDSVVVTAGLSGRWVNVNRADGPDASFTRTIAPNDSLTIRWDAANAHAAERDAYYHVTLIHDFITTLDPVFTGISYSMPCAVNINETCNAFWDGGGVNFFHEGGGCPNTAQMPDVVYHEYGHGINDRLYEQLGRPFGMINGGAHEGMADVSAAMIMDDFRVGRGFFGPGTVLRSLQNSNSYPQNVSSDPHITGLIIGGAFWDLRMATSLQTMRELAHFAKYGLPDDLDDGVMFGEWFLETLIADDDDGNLANGTPHGAAIIAAFNAHGIGSRLFFRQSFSHTPLPSTDDTTEAYVAVFSLLGVPGVGADSVRVVYSTDRWSTVHVVPAEEFVPATFRAAIPPQPAGTIVRYFVSAREPVGGVTYTFPEGAPGADAYRFLVGRQFAEPGVAYATTNAWPSGYLYRVDPATGNATAIGPLGLQSVQALAVHPETHELYALAAGTEGTSVYRLSPVQGDAFTDRVIPLQNVRAAAFAGGDTVYIADAGSRIYRCVGTDTTLLGNAQGLFLASLAIHPLDGSLWASVRPPLAMRDRIYRIDKQTGAPTLVGATGDNLPTPAIAFGPEGVLYGLKNPSTLISTLITIDTGTGTGTVVGPSGITGLATLAMRPDSLVTSAEPEAGSLPEHYGLSQNYPNPFNGETIIGYDLPAGQAWVTLKVFDVLGREVAVLVNGRVGPGAHTAAFRSDGLPSGVYFYRLRAEADQGGFVEVRKMLLLK